MFDMERTSFKNLNNLEVREQYQVKISNRFAAVENLDDDNDNDNDNDDDDDDMNINRTLESITKNIKASATDSLGYELKQYKPWFNELFKIIGTKKAG
jgi:hypothetical protein